MLTNGCSSGEKTTTTNASNSANNSVQAKIANLEPRIDTEKPFKADGIDLLIGVVDGGGEEDLCLRICNPELNLGDKITVLFKGAEKDFGSVRQAHILQKSETSCASGDSELGERTDRNSYYLLRLEGDQEPAVNLGFGMLKQAKKPVLRKGSASVDIDGDGKDEFFRVCASTEGLHLTVWAGEPLKSKRVWHRYYYLGYDVNPDCKEKETEETGEFDE